MGKGGVGIGSASIVLVFAVLCLTVFTLITFVVSANDKALVDAEARLVTGYYEADSLAEQVLAVVLSSDEIPDTIYGVDIESVWDFEYGAETVSYFCPISDIKSLYVHVAIYYDTFDVISWRMWDIDEWEFDDSLNVWTGDENNEWTAILP